MADTSPGLTAAERDALAADLVRGALSDDEAALARQLALADPDFAAAVRAWERRLAPPTSRIGDGPDWDDPVRPGPEADPELRIPRPEPESPEVAYVARMMKVWRAAALFMTVVAVITSVLVVFQPEPPPPPQPAPTRFVAMLATPSAGVAGWTVAVDANRQQISLAPLGDTAPPVDVVQQVWFTKDAKTAPISLGVIESATRLKAPADLLRFGGTLTVTHERSNTAPSPQPTGPTVYSGVLTPFN